MVERYELSEEWGDPVLSEYPYGEWVKYEDYERLKREAMNHIASIQKQYDALALAYAELENKVATK